MSQLICRDLTLGYESEKVIEHLSFHVDRGDYLCIIGENGSGKSTLIKAITHLHEPLCGSIETGDGLLPNEIGYLPQQTAVQRDFPASVREIVLSGCLSRCGKRPYYNRLEKQLAADNMAKLHITELANRCYRELSGGQQQRVLLARALCAAEKLLLLDEPVSGLDPKAAAQMYDLIKLLNRSGTTIIMVSHDVSAAMRCATHILHIGTPIFFGTKEEYIKSDAGKRYLISIGGTAQ